MVAALVPGTASAAVGVSQFAVTPSTTQAGGHPNLSASFSLAEPSTAVKDVAVHLPAGLSATSEAIPFCTRRRLVRNLCLPKSKAGSLDVTVVLYGIEFPVRKDIFNVRPIAAEPLRLGVPILGCSAGRGSRPSSPWSSGPPTGASTWRSRGFRASSAAIRCG